jgi:uncharacterized OsmC-like protein
VSITQHKLTIDEPQSLGGADGRPHPVELTFGAPGSCQEITCHACASALGIPLESVSVTIEGDIDLRGFIAVDDSVRVNYQAIRPTAHVVSGASEEQIELLRGAVTTHCTVLEIAAKPVPVELLLKIALPPVKSAA